MGRGRACLEHICRVLLPKPTPRCAFHVTAGAGQPPLRAARVPLPPGGPPDQRLCHLCHPGVDHRQPVPARPPGSGCRSCSTAGRSAAQVKKGGDTGEWGQRARRPSPGTCCSVAAGARTGTLHVYLQDRLIGGRGGAVGPTVSALRPGHDCSAMDTSLTSCLLLAVLL